VRFIVDGIEDRSGVGEKCAKPVDHQAFQIAGRYPPAARTGPSRPGEEGSRNIVPIARSLLDRMGWRQALAGFVKNHAGQQAGVACARSRCPLNPVCGQHGLDIVAQRLVRRQGKGRALSRLLLQDPDTPGRRRARQRARLCRSRPHDRRLVAFPARYRASGVMTFIVNQDGVVYEKNFGPDSAQRARAMTSFNPDSSWKKL
jgi:Protein of unknown function (DUF2950)